MIMEGNPSFSFEKKEKMDTENSRVQEWEALMSKYQKNFPLLITEKNGYLWIEFLNSRQ